jgi:hypothetical protein
MALASKSELVHLQNTLKTDQAIAKKFGVTRQAIHQLREKYGIPSRRALIPGRDKKVAALYKHGATGIEIAKKIGLSVSQTYRILSSKKK